MIPRPTKATKKQTQSSLNKTQLFHRQQLQQTQVESPTEQYPKRNNIIPMHYDCYSSQLMRKKRQASLESINKAFNSIGDMKNKNQINHAILMIPDVKDRVELLGKMLERRSQIEQAKDMQIISNHAALFQKIKQKFLNSLHRTVEAKQKSFILVKSSTPTAGFRKENSLPEQSLAQVQKPPVVGVSPSISSPNITEQQQQVRLSVVEQKSDQIIEEVNESRRKQSFEDTNRTKQSVMLQSKNVLGALSLFAAHDTSFQEKDRENNEKIRHNKLLGYLQIDNNLKGEEKSFLQNKQQQLLKSTGNHHPHSHLNHLQHLHSSQHHQVSSKRQGQSRSLNSSSLYLREAEQQENLENNGNNNNIGLANKQNQLRRTLFSENQLKTCVSYQEKTKNNLNSQENENQIITNSLSSQQSSTKSILLPKRNSINFNRIKSRKERDNTPQQAYLFDFITECEQKRAQLQIQKELFNSEQQTRVQSGSRNNFTFHNSSSEQRHSAFSTPGMIFTSAQSTPGVQSPHQKNNNFLPKRPLECFPQNPVSKQDNYFMRVQYRVPLRSVHLGNATYQQNSFAKSIL